jgi:hypothetical protein
MPMLSESRKISTDATAGSTATLTGCVSVISHRKSETKVTIKILGSLPQSYAGSLR